MNPDVASATRATDAGPPTLARRVLAELEAAGVAHCHWKSNDHLRAALDGDTDVDLLVDGERLDDVYRIFAAFGLRRGRVASSRTEMGLEDFLGHDDTTGALVHVHTHYRLVTGERHLKRYRLPWERAVLASVVRTDSGVLVPDPSVEASLLLIRAALKIRARDRVGARLGRRDLWFGAELDALRAATTDAEIVAQVGSWLGRPCAEAVADALAHGIDSGAMVRLRRLVRRSLALQTAYRGPGAVVRRWRREWAWFQRGVSRRYLDRPRLYGRGLPGGGLLVVVIGADGSGKSSIVADLRRWFSPKFDTMAVYFGSGDGPSSPLRWPMKVLRDHVHGDQGAPAATATGKRRLGRRPGWAKVLWALALAREKRQRLQRAFDARHRGMLVICDRYPQAQRPGINDGPLLQLLSGAGARGRIARWEARPYELAERFPPDLVVRLGVDQRTAERRRPEHDPDDLARRQAVVAELAFPDARYGTVEIDAGQPYEHVLEAVKVAVWRCL